MSVPRHKQIPPYHVLCPESSCVSVSREYGYSLTAAVRRWADEFGLWIVMDVVSEDKGLDDSRDYGPELFPPSPDFTVTYDGPEVAINSEDYGDIAATSD